MTATLNIPPASSLASPIADSESPSSKKTIRCIVVDESPLCRKLLQLALADCDGAVLTECCSKIDEADATNLPEVIIACDENRCLTAITNWLENAEQQVQLLLLSDDSSAIPPPQMAANVQLSKIRKPRFVSEIEAELADFSHCLNTALNRD